MTLGQVLGPDMGSRQTDPFTAVRRHEDDELLGLLVPGSDGQWTPSTVFGAALAPATDAERAESLVREHGLSSLADRWWVHTDDDGWREAWLLEVKPDQVRLRWQDPMLEQAGHGQWIRLADAQIQRSSP